MHTNLYLGECALAEGDEARAVEILTAAFDEALAERIEALALQSAMGLATLWLRRGHYSVALGLAAAAMAQPVATYEIKTRAMAVCTAASGHMDDAQCAAAEDWGKGLTLQEMATVIHRGVNEFIN